MEWCGNERGGFRMQVGGGGKKRLEKGETGRKGRIVTCCSDGEGMGGDEDKGVNCFRSKGRVLKLCYMVI